jgi:hypothetical protein
MSSGKLVFVFVFVAWENAPTWVTEIKEESASYSK